jgi:hypothetical protein
MSSQSKQFEILGGELEIATSELIAVEKHISQTSYGMLKDKFDAMTKEISDATAEVEQMEKTKKEKWVLYNELKKMEAQLKEAKDLVASKEKAAREVCQLAV